VHPHKTTPCWNSNPCPHPAHYLAQQEIIARETSHTYNLLTGHRNVIPTSSHANQFTLSPNQQHQYNPTGANSIPSPCFTVRPPRPHSSILTQIIPKDMTNQSAPILWVLHTNEYLWHTTAASKHTITTHPHLVHPHRLSSELPTPHQTNPKHCHKKSIIPYIIKHPLTRKINLG